MFILIPCTVHLFLFCTMNNSCKIISQMFMLLHVSTLSCHPQWAFNEYLANLHKYVKCSCWYYNLHKMFYNANCITNVWICNTCIIWQKYGLQAAWGWHDSVETCRRVNICEIIVHLLVIVQNNLLYCLFMDPSLRS